MGQPQYRLEGIVHTRSETMEDFEGPLDVIFLLLSKNKIEIQDVSITAILDQYLAYLDEMKRLDMEIGADSQGRYGAGAQKRDRPLPVHQGSGAAATGQNLPLSA